MGAGRERHSVWHRWESVSGLTFNWDGLAQGLKTLSVLSLVESELNAIPEELSGLSALTSLDLTDNDFEESDMDVTRNNDYEWWPTTMSRWAFILL